MILGVAALISLHSCNNASSDAQTANSPDSIKLAEKYMRPDTLHYKDQVIHLESIDSNDFFRLPSHASHSFNLDSIEQIDDPVNVYRHDSTLILKFNNGDSARLVSSPNSTNDTLVLVYRYVGYLRSLNRYLVLDNLYEGAYYSLWNKSSGNETRIFGNPTESPDGKTILCYNLDIFAHYSPNGFQLFSVANNGNLNLEWQHETWWGPNECRWKDNQTVLIKTNYLDSTSSIKTKYLKMKLPDFSK